MDDGWRYEYRAAVYPRYIYFQRRLTRLLPRLENILEAGHLPNCLSRGRENLLKIAQSVNQLRDTIAIYVFGNPERLERAKTEIPVYKKHTFDKKTSVTFDDHLHELREDIQNEPTITVIFTTAAEKSRLMTTLESKFSGTQNDCFKNTIINIGDTNTNYLYAVLMNEDAESKKALDMGEKSRRKDLAIQIQYVLERKAVTVLERILDYIRDFIPTPTYGATDLLLEHEIYSKLQKSLRDPFVVKDLSPFPKESSERTDRTATDTELQTIASALGSGWEQLGPSLGISPAEISSLKNATPLIEDQCLSLLKLWREKYSTDTLRYLLEVLHHMTSFMQVSVDALKELEDKILKENSAIPYEEKNKRFRANLLNFVSKKTKCVTIDTLAKKYGIRQSLINEFLNEGLFGFEKKVWALDWQIVLPDWPSDKSDNGIKACRFFTYRCVDNLKILINETEDYIKKQYDILVLTKRLQFETLGLLKQTNITTVNEVPDIPKLPIDLQKALLQLSDVYGCGTIWGELVVHVTKSLAASTKHEIQEILSKYRYKYPYLVQIVEPFREHAGGNVVAEHGTTIRAQKLHNVANASQSGEECSGSSAKHHQHGTLGCFVRFEPKNSESSGVTSDNKGFLYAVTCAHVIRDCQPEVEIRPHDEFKLLGRTEHEIYKPEALDVATVKVGSNIKCSTGLKDCSGQLPWCSASSPWRFYEKPLIGMSVYKHGSNGFTKGVCASVDYQTKQISELNENLGRSKMDPLYNILISPSADIPQQAHAEVSEMLQPVGTGTEESHGSGMQREDEDDRMEDSASGHNQPSASNDDDSNIKPFSDDGDSGSVVCEDDVDTGCVMVISLLHGALFEKNKPDGSKGKFLFSYTSSMVKTVQELEKQYNCTITPATD